jgi:hypothetical protein
VVSGITGFRRTVGAFAAGQASHAVMPRAGSLFAATSCSTICAWPPICQADHEINTFGVERGAPTPAAAPDGGRESLDGEPQAANHVRGQAPHIGGDGMACAHAARCRISGAQSYR